LDKGDDMTSCWGITDGSAGMVAQVRALANALELKPEMKVISLKKPWSLLPNICYAGGLKSCIMACALRNPETLAGPYPDMVISCGRKAALVALALKKAAEKIKTVHIQDPQMPSRNFDLVVAMQHDKIQDGNVIKTTFALHNITPATLDEAYKKFAPRFSAYPKPHIAVLLGGSTNKYNLTKSRMETLISDLQKRLTGTQGSLLITPSRRTGAENIMALEKSFSANKNIYIYDGKEENPYMGMLACADEIIVTNDSVNMMSEALATGKKVTILNLEGHENTKPARFAEMIQTNPKMTGSEMPDLAREIKLRLKI
jgi:mitochondrial fission protein ELM1